MRVLWISNGLLPEAAAMLCGRAEIKGTGGWLTALAEAVANTGEVELFVASITPFVSQLVKIQGNNICHFAIPYKGDSIYKVKYEEAFRSIYNEIKPDVVHIHGTEFPHSLAALKACGRENTVVSIQGMASVISRYYLANLSNRVIRSNPSIHDLFRYNLFQQQREMEKRGQYEQQLIKDAMYVIGRTTWDKAHVWAINPYVEYFHCNELLRREFYDGDCWSYRRCVPHSIFLSQGRYPLKGLHKVLQALPLVRKICPDVSVRIAGPDITFDGAGLKGLLKISTYGRIIKKIIKHNKLESTVSFLGPLNAIKMKEEYLRANVFVCSSSIENSPNSLGEAQVLGVPCVASYVGGIPDFMRGGEDFLYRYDDVEMMAAKICKAFDMGENAHLPAMQEVARSRHNEEDVVYNVLKIYKEVSRERKRETI